MSALRNWVLGVAACVSLVGCGSSSGTSGPVCQAGETSQPGSIGDPCPQTGTDCANAGKPAYATCTAEGTWDQCVCQGAGMCGNGTREGTEQCDGADLAGASCGSLSLGTGTLVCDVQTCMYDLSLCTNQTGTGGNGSGGNGG